MTDPRASEVDLTARARIRNAALDLYAEQGEDRVSLRAVASAAGVTVGLVQHHFKTKDGLRDAVEELVVAYHAQAIADASADGTPAQVAAARDEAVRQMLRRHPPVINYMRRALLDPAGRHGHLLERLVDLSRTEVAKLRDAGLASTAPTESAQVLRLMVRQFGELFLQPMVDTLWEHITGSDQPGVPAPEVTVRLAPDPNRQST